MERTACITKILKERHEEPVTVYNLAVKDWVSYFVGQVRVYVHNGNDYNNNKSIINLIDDIDEITDDIIKINKKYSDGFELNNSIKNILNSASYYDDPYEQGAAVTRSITDHAFANGNKRTAFDTTNMLLSHLMLNNKLTDSQKWHLIYDIAEGRLNDVTKIANIFKGK